MARARAEPLKVILCPIILGSGLIIPPVPKNKSFVNKPNAEYEKQRDRMKQKLQIILPGKIKKSPRAQVSQPNQRAGNEKKRSSHNQVDEHLPFVFGAHAT
jgi:hypothetical protein